MENNIYTIGYAGFTLESLIATLLNHRISVLIDVRSKPYSKLYHQFDKEKLAYNLSIAGVHYRNYSSEFGARQDNPKYYTEEGYLDFELYVRSSGFKNGFTKLSRSMEMDYRIVLMCAEKDPLDCHRAIMVARKFHESGYNVIHFKPDGDTESHQSLENRLMRLYCDYPNQISIFDSMEQKSTRLVEAYRRRNADIGFVLEDL